MNIRRIEVTNNHTMQKLITILEDLKGTATDVIFYFTKPATLYLNSSNLIILQKLAKKFDIALKYETQEPMHSDYIDSVNNDYLNYAEEEVDLDDTMNIVPPAGNKKTFFKLPEINLPKFSMPSFKKSEKTRNVEVEDNVEAGVEKINRGLIAVVFIVILGLVGIVSAFAALMYYIPSAKINLELEEDVLVKLLDVKASTALDSVDLDNSVIPADSLTVEESDTAKLATTGKKEVGEFATGEITIFNKTDSEKRVKKGTTIKLKKDESKDNEALTFVTTDEVKVPPKELKTVSVGGSETQGDVFGTKIVKVKASKIGKEYNIEENQKFEISGYNEDQLYGENEKGFNGGERKEVNVVANDDILNIRKNLEDALKAKLKDSLSKKVVNGQVLNEGSISYETVKATYNKKLDEETDELTLDLTMKASGVAYLENDLKEVVKVLARKVVPEEFKLANENYDYEVAVLKAPNQPSIINLQVKLRSYITPNIDEEAIKRDTAGLKIDQAEEYLNKIRNIKKYEISLSPRLPSFLTSMPRRKENITIEIKR